jgi:hypothetical protein
MHSRVILKQRAIGLTNRITALEEHTIVAMSYVSGVGAVKIYERIQIVRVIGVDLMLHKRFGCRIHRLTSLDMTGRR